MKSHGRDAHGILLPLLDKLGYRGLIMQVSEAPKFPNELDDDLQKVNRSGKIFSSYSNNMSPDGAADLMKRCDIPRSVDVLKINVDSYDLALLRGILQQRFEPKILIIETNGDLAPPINWELQYDPNFVFKAKSAGKGVFGASPDAIYEAVSQQNQYSLIGFDMQHRRQDMWFVHNSLVQGKAQATQPLVSWRGMVRMFWSQQYGRRCAHIPHKVYSCPLNFLREIYKEAHGVLPSNFTRDSWEQMADISIYLADPNFMKKDPPYGYVTLLNQALKGQCGSKHCPTSFKVMKDLRKNVTMHDEEDDEEPSLIAVAAKKHKNWFTGRRSI